MARMLVAALCAFLTLACDDGGGGQDVGVDGDADRDGEAEGDADVDADDAPDGDADEPSDAESAEDADPDPDLPPRPLPDIGDISVNCSEFTLSDLRRAKEVYDETFGDHLPATDEELGWQLDETLVSRELVERVTFHGLPPRAYATAEYHELFDFNPHRFERDTTRTNWDIFGELDPLGDPLGPYRGFNPQDLSPASATHYSTGESSDIIATQFVFRIGCNRAEMEEAFALCPECEDLIVALSREDMYRVFEVRFVRAAGRDLEVSRPIRMISIDSSGHDAYFTDDLYRYRFVTFPSGEVLRAYRRVEISGRMAQNLGTYGGPTGLLLRAVEENTYPAP